MNVKYFTGHIDQQNDDVVMRLLFSMGGMLLLLFTNFIGVGIIGAIIALIGLNYLVNLVIVKGLIFLAIGGLVLWKLVPYLRKNRVPNPFQQKHGASTQQIKKVLKTYYNDFNMTDEEIKVSIAFTKLMVDYFLDSRVFTVTSKGKQFKDSLNRQYEFVNVPLVALYYHYDKDGDFDTNSRIDIFADIRFIDKLSDIENEVNNALSRVGLSALRVKFIEVEDSTIYIDLEDVKQPTLFHFPKIAKEKSMDQISILEDLASKTKVDEIPLSKDFTYNMTKAPHLVIAGGTGSGKSYFMNYVLWQLGIKGHKIYIADPKRSDLSSFDLYMPVERVQSSQDGISNMFKEAYEEMERRYEQMDKMRREDPVKYNNKSYVDFGLTGIVVIVDELSSYMGNFSTAKESKEFSNYMKQIVNKGRQAGVFLWLMMQQPSANNLPTELRNQMGFKLYLGSTLDSDYRMLFGDTSELPNRKLNQGQGFMMVTGSGQSVTVLHTPHLIDSEVHQTNEYALKKQFEFD